MKTLLIITYVDFWRKGAGHRSRLSSLLDYIKDHFTITIAYAGIFNDRDTDILRKNYSQVEMVPLERNRTVSFKELAPIFQSFIAGRKFDIALVEYIELSFLLPMLDEHTFTILDTHDLVGDRIRSFRENNVPDYGPAMTDEEELAIFNCFNKVLLIQKNDYRKIGEQIGFDRAMLVPHAAMLRKQRLRDHARAIGFVASEYVPNVEAAVWFLNDVWPMIDKSPGLSMNIYGNIVRRLPKAVIDNNPGVQFHGFVDDIDTIYNHCDIMINPVKFGAGLKIKNVEALSAGLPLITSTHGSRGIEDGMNESFIVADTAVEFASAITEVVNNDYARRRLANNAYAFAERAFSPASCYEEFMNCMREYQLAG
jgi:glycosyltransferase involved in cell wall biosynthesis